MRLTPEQLVIQCLHPVMRSSGCYFYGSAINEINDVDCYITYLSLYYIPKTESFFYISFIEESAFDVVSMGFIVPYKFCWIAISLPVNSPIIEDTDEIIDFDRKYDLTADYYVSLQCEILYPYEKEIKYEFKLNYYLHDCSCNNQNYCCELIDDKPMFHDKYGDMGLCFEFNIKHKLWLL